MAAQRIRAANSSGLPRCKSEGTLMDLSDGLPETSLSDVKGEPGEEQWAGRGRWLGETERPRNWTGTSWHLMA